MGTTCIRNPDCFCDLTCSTSWEFRWIDKNIPSSHSDLHISLFLLMSDQGSSCGCEMERDMVRKLLVRQVIPILPRSVGLTQLRASEY